MPPHLNSPPGSVRVSTSVEADGRLGLSLRHAQRRANLSAFLPKDETNASPKTGYSSAGVESESESDFEWILDVPIPTRLCIVIQVVGSRGDVQPFVALGLTLHKKYGHRVRIATHGVFQRFVEENDLEFFDIGGDPEELMAFMVRNPGLLPSYSSLRNGDVKQQRANMRAILDGCWRSCVQPTCGRPFIADAIIANPPSFAHIHCAEKLGIPLHLMFTMPYSPTETFPHPLANIQRSDLSPGLTNKLSFALIERITWHGLGDIVNRFREESLGLTPINLAWAPGLITRLNIPYTYCWSPSLLRKPKDWGPGISVSGFYFLPTEGSFEPPTDLVQFINSGEPPVYIGFGSIVVDDPQSMTELIFAAVEKAGVRALVSRGWSGIGDNMNDAEPPASIFLLGNVPHSWLFEHVSAVIHHGGAGTTAAGLAAGKPTVIVPFFGDAFWGDVVANAGAGPHPIPYSKQTVDTLASHIRQALHPDTRLRARHIQMNIRNEQGCENGARHFHKMLPAKDMQCTLDPKRHAVWFVKRKDIRLSAMAAALLLEKGFIGEADLALYRSKEYVVKDLPTDPLTGGAFAFLGSFSDVLYEAYSLPRAIARDMSDSSRTPSSSSAPCSTPTNSVAAASVSLMEEGKMSLDSRDSTSPNLATSGRIAITAATGIGRFSKAVLSAPMNFSMGIARGFQSIPILYGDKTVREPEKVTSLLKGIEVGSKELMYGFYDGITGVVTQPIQGAKKSGAVGFTKGLARGLGGLVLKPGAGLFGLPAYSLQGVSQEVHNLLGVNHERLIAHSRLEQGKAEMEEAPEEEKWRILRAWKAIS